MVAKAVMADKASGNPQTEPGILFDLSERIGYVISGLTAWEVAQTSGHISFAQREKLQWLAGNVLANQYEILRSYAESGRQSAQYFLRERRDDFLAILEHATNLTSLGLHDRYCEAAGLGHKIVFFHERLHAAKLHLQQAEAA